MVAFVAGSGVGPVAWLFRSVLYADVDEWLTQGSGNDTWKRIGPGRPLQTETDRHLVWEPEEGVAVFAFRAGAAWYCPGMLVNGKRTGNQIYPTLYHPAIEDPDEELGRIIGSGWKVGE